MKRSVEHYDTIPSNFPLSYGQRGYRPPGFCHTAPFLAPCPCHCNSSLTYMLNGIPAHRPKTAAEFIEWFNCPFSYEEPNLSRFHFGINYTSEEITKRLDEADAVARNNIIMRCIPKLMKNVNNIFVGSLPVQLWDLWISRLCLDVPGLLGKRTIRPNSHQEIRHRVQTRSVKWEKILPNMGLPYWWKKKWIHQSTGDIFRAEVLSLMLIYNPYNNFIRAKIEYQTEHWDGAKWQSCNQFWFTKALRII